MHLEYFKFAGHMIALALMHRIHVGVFFDRTLFLRPDIADTDPSLHKSCKQILEMDPSLVDSNVLGLTFVREVEDKTVHNDPSNRRSKRKNARSGSHSGKSIPWSKYTPPTAAQ